MGKLVKFEQILQIKVLHQGSFPDINNYTIIVFENILALGNTQG